MSDRGDLSDEPIVGRFYKHFRGGLYTVMADAAFHTEREDERLVIYRHVSGTVYARPRREWFKPADTSIGGIHDYNPVKRFTILPENFKCP